MPSSNTVHLENGIFFKVADLGQHFKNGRKTGSSIELKA
jgi:hypothetical protein